MQMSVDRGLLGVSLFALGYQDDQVWDDIADDQRHPHHRARRQRGRRAHAAPTTTAPTTTAAPTTAGPTTTTAALGVTTTTVAA